MLLAPFTSMQLPTRLVAARVDARTRLPPWLLLWAAVGALALCVVPGLRGNGVSGLTLPFWLVGAPLLDIAWMSRMRWLAALRALAGDCRSRRFRTVRWHLPR